MTEEERETLFQQMLGLNDDKKSSILSRTFGYFQHVEETNEIFEPERFFKIVEDVVGSITVEDCKHEGVETIRIGGEDETITICHDCGKEL